MRFFATVAAFVVVASTSFSASASEWKYRLWQSQHAGIGDWITTQCKTSDPGGVDAIISQNGPGAAYNIHVWCRVDNDMTKKWSDQHLQVVGGNPMGEMVALIKETDRFAIIGFINNGQAADVIVGVRMSSVN